ncbi:MAG: von Willebrand factor type A domain-containing protein [Myxococcota bacterium]
MGLGAGCYSAGANAYKVSGSSVEMMSADGFAPRRMEPFPTDREDYNHIEESDFFVAADFPLSTFSVDVDTASYSNARRFLSRRQLPPADAVRIEEMINYFEYDYAEPAGPHPFSVTAEIGTCPWNEAHQLVHVGIQGKHVELDEVPSRNLVFLIDVSGSMDSEDKLGLLKKSLSMLADQLRPQDSVAIVVYAGASGLVLPPTNDKRQIKKALRRLDAGGSTAGAAGLALAYQVARRNFEDGAINRVIMASDGDLNVGPSSQGELVDLIEEYRESGVFLSILGYGSGNLNDALMEQVADHGNGHYAYIDSEKEARRVLVEQVNATLVPIAADVKLQVEFNPAKVEAYRLVGYENRALDAQDFNDDRKDAGEIGAGHSVTALYEVVPAGAGEFEGSVDPSRYQTDSTTTAAATASSETMFVKIRYKNPGEANSQLVEQAVDLPTLPLADTSDDFRFSAAVAGFGMLLRDSEHKGDVSYRKVRTLAKGALGRDPREVRREFVDLVGEAAEITRRRG